VRYGNAAIVIRRGTAQRVLPIGAVLYRAGSNSTAADQVPNFGALGFTQDNCFHQKTSISIFLMLLPARMKFQKFEILQKTLIPAVQYRAGSIRIRISWRNRKITKNEKNLRIMTPIGSD
jgi:hypothetical protein